MKIAAFKKLALSLLAAVATPAFATPELVLTEINSNGAGGDFWELTNVGTTAANVGNWKWIDGGQSLPAPAVQVIPAGTTIAPGETVVFITDTSNSTTFLNAWGSLTGVQKFVGGPGLGQNDSVRLYDSSDTLIFNFTYAASGFTQSSGGAAAGGHAGASAGGAATNSAVIDSTFGSGAGRRYRAASVGVDGAYANTGGAVGSPGLTGLGGGSPTITLTLDVTPATFSESAVNPAGAGTVTRSGSTTGDLVVSLSSSDTTEATVPASVTILNGQASAPFNVTAVNDSFPDGSKNATITATATGATAGTFQVTVTDDGDVLQNNLLLTEVLSQQSATGVNDFWELTNISGATVSLAGYSWHDEGQSAPTAAAYALPPGSSIAPGESVIFTQLSPAAFRTWWGISNSVQVFQTVGAPGLGQNDGVSFFDEGGNMLFYFNYEAGTFTKADGSPSTGGHAGPSAGASTETQSAIWVPSSGTTSPRYSFATVGHEGCFASATSALDIGSPGVSVGNPTVSIADASVVEGHGGTTTLALQVTRSNTATAFTVGYAVTGGDATSGTDYAPLASGTLSFTAAGDATLPINITVHGDTDSELDETIVVTLSNVVNTAGTTVIGDGEGVGTILNDDVVVPTITVHPAPTTIATGYTATLTVAASGFPVPSIQWYQGNSGDTSTPVGTNSPSFTTPALIATTSYWARATNAGGSDDSDTATVSVTTGPTAIDLSQYVRVGRFDLPEPTRTTPPANNLLGQEASGVTYNWDTDTLFIVGDGGTSVTQVTKTGALVSAMTLPPGGSSQGTEFFDTEGITYIGGGQFVFTEERDRQAVKFTFVGGGTLLRAATQTVKLGTTIGNLGLEGLTWDPQTSGFIFVKEAEPIGIFQTTIDFNAGTASNGSPATVNSADLFPPALASLEDMSDVFAFSNLPSMVGQPSAGNLLILSQESGLIRQVDRAGNIVNTLTLVADAGNPLTIQNQTHEGLTMDRAGHIYVVSENGGGDTDHPQLWVYAPSNAVNSAPTVLALSTPSTTIPDSTSTAAPIKMATIVVADADGVGVNDFSVSGADAADFTFIGTGLYLKAGTVLNGTTKPIYNVVVNVDDTAVGGSPDASANFTLNVTGAGGGAGTIRVTEVAPWSSGESLLGADWFELTNTGSTAVNITGWRMFDSGASGFGGSGPLNGITSIAPGESVIFVDGQAKVPTFVSHWFGSNPGVQVGYYGGPGLSTGGDAVTIYNGSGTLQARVDFGTSPGAAPRGTFDNSAGLDNVVLSQLSVVGQNGAFTAAASTNDIGSPGSAAVSGSPLVSIMATDASASEAGAGIGTFRISRTGSMISPMQVIYSIATGAGHAVAADYTPTLTSPATIPAGESFVDITITPVDDLDVEGDETITLTLGDAGSYDVGSPAFATVTITDNDTPNMAPTAVVLNNTVPSISDNTSTASPVRVADISVTDDGQGTNVLSLSGADADSFEITSGSLYLKAGTALNYLTKPTYAVTVNVDDASVGVSPDASANFTLTITQFVAPGTIIVSEVAPWSSGNSGALDADWFELTNIGATPVNIAGWKVDDSSNAFGTALVLNGITTIGAGESVIFIETSNIATSATAFRTLWFGANPPANLQVGGYSGSSIGLSTSGDAVNIFDASGHRITGVSFGTATTVAPFRSFDNTAGAGSTTLPLPTISTLSAVGVNSAFTAANPPQAIGSPGTAVAYTLQLLHLADGEAGLLAPNTAPNLAALVDAFDDDYANTLILAGGDNWIPGPFLAAGTDLSVRDELNATTGSTMSLAGSFNHPIAAVDIAIHNLIGVEVSAIGNHEFDLGSRVLRDSFTAGSVAGWVGANFPHVSANLDFSGDADLNPRFTNTLDGGTGTLIPEANTLNGRIAPSVVVTKGGQKIGIVGATTQIVESISSPSGTEVKGFPTGAGPNGEVDDMVLLASQLQPVIDELIAEGVNKIVVMAHLQVLNNERTLAPLLSGVDVILAAGSNTRLGDANDVPVAFPGHSANFADTYPILTAGLDGKPTVIVNTDNEYTYLGRLVVDFDANGNIIVPKLASTSAINGAYAATPANVAAAWGVAEGDLPTTAFADGTKGENVADLTDAVQAVVTSKDGNIAGFTHVYLQGERIAVRNEETNLGNLSADANAAALVHALGSAGPTTFVASLKNGGGIRAQIGTISAPDPLTGEVTYLPPAANPAAGKPTGAVSQLDIENSLRFNNLLMAFDTTPAGLKAILEHGVALLPNQGRFPQIGGIRFSYDPALTAGSRVLNVVLINEADEIVARLIENGVVHANAPVSITLITLNFLAQGGDSYPMKANGENFRYLLANGTLSAPLAEALDFTAAGNIPGNAVGEQTVLFDYFASRYPTAGTAYAIADTPIAQDTRIQNINTRTDAVQDGPVFTPSSFRFVSTNYGTHEAAGFVTLEIARDGSVGSAATVLVSTTDGTAVSPLDYTALTNEPVSFGIGQTTSSVLVPIVDRAGPQGTRSFTANIASVPSGSTITGGTTTVAIAENAGAISFAEATYTVNPVDTTGLPNTVAVVISRGGNAGGAVDVTVTASLPATVPSGMAKLDNIKDYTLAGNTATVSFADGEGTRTLNIPLRSTARFGRFLLTLSAPTGGATLGSPVQTLVEVSKKDTTAPTLNVTFGTANASGVANISGTAADGGAVSSGLNRVELVVVNVNGTSAPVGLTLTTGAFNEDIQLQHGVNKLTVTAYDNSGKKTSRTASVTYTNTAITALAGTTYSGLLVPNTPHVEASNDNSGLLTVTVATSTAVSGKLAVGGVSVSFSGALDSTGALHFKPTSSTHLDVVDKKEFDSYLGSLSVTISPGLAIGTLKTHAGGLVLGTAEAVQHATAASPSLLAGTGAQKYSVALPSKAQASLTVEEYPQGDGYVSVTVSPNGSVSVSGLLADGVTLSASGKLRVATATTQSVALHKNLYRNGGSFAVELVFDLSTAMNADSDVLGTDALWIRSNQPRARYYKAGWTAGVSIDAIGARYTAPSVGAVLPGLGTTSPNAQLQFQDGNLPALTTRDLDITATNGFANKSSDAALKLSITKSSGIFKGIFTHADATKPTYQGIILQEGANAKGFGFFLSTPTMSYDGAGESGGVTLAPKP